MVRKTSSSVGVRSVSSRTEMSASLSATATSLIAAESSLTETTISSPHGCSADRIESGGGLVEKQHFGIVNQRSSKIETTLHAPE